MALLCGSRAPFCKVILSEGLMGGPAASAGKGGWIGGGKGGNRRTDRRARHSTAAWPDQQVAMSPQFALVRLRPDQHRSAPSRPRAAGQNAEPPRHLLIGLQHATH